jgi:hypothetical protein
MTSERGRVNRKEFWGLLGIVAAVIFLWDTPAVYPLQVLVVFFHEMSHGAAAILTGGSIREISVVPEQGGFCVTEGGSRFLILSAGYLGSLAWGGAILVLSSRTRHDRLIAGVTGALLAATSLLFVRPFLSFGFLFGTASGAALVASAARLPAGFNDFVLRVIGLTSCLYAILDIKSDVLDRRGIGSDADMLAEITPLPSVAWGALWIRIAVGVAVYALRLAARGEAVVPAAAGPPASRTEGAETSRRSPR